jgi:shikimate dehydrogenase
MKLGLFGAGIGHSLAPFLHQQAGLQLGLKVSYPLFDTPAEQFPKVILGLKNCQEQGFTGVNVTHPFKDLAKDLVQIENPHIRAIGSINTIRFSDQQGFNTDYSGFIRAYQARFATTPPGSVTLLGAGGAGKAVAFALVALGATSLQIMDLNTDRAKDLAQRLPITTTVLTPEELETAPTSQGLVNCTPIGMYQYPGIPINPALIGRQDWIFDAIYTPLETSFLRQAREKGIAILGGAELFFYQGVDAFEIWSGLKLDETALYSIIQEKLKQRELAQPK